MKLCCEVKGMFQIETAHHRFDCQILEVTVFRVQDTLSAISNAFIIKGLESTPSGQMLALPNMIGQHEACIAQRQFSLQSIQ